MTVTRDKELWALALWVEKHHGADGRRFIAENVGGLARDGEQGGVDLWREVAARFDQLSGHGVGVDVGASVQN